MRQSTHSGECQLCGRKQKLPGGKLSKHGYTVQWGFFSGVCPGAHHDPFEVSKDLIQSYRDRSAAQALHLRDVADQTIRGERDEHLTASRYYAHNAKNKPRSVGRGGGYVQERVSVESETKSFGDGSGRTYTVVFLAFADGETTQKTPGSATEKLAEIRQQNAKRIISSAMDHERYVAWQDKRMQDWSPKPLTPVVEEVSAATAAAGTVVKRVGYDDVELLARTDRLGRGGRYIRGWQVRRVTDGRTYFETDAEITKALKRAGT